jgi:prolyl oligopeptidase
MRRLYLTVILALPAPAFAIAQQPTVEDPFLWLEEVDGTRAMEWVTRHNRLTLDRLQRHPAYDSIFRRSLEIYDSQDRIPTPSLRGSRIYNFWQDSAHVRGIWRRASIDSYASRQPAWETMLDLDAIARADSVPWAWGGASCLPPGYVRCLVGLSRGGSDAVEIREFDVDRGEFVAGGFRLPEAKSSVAWIDDSTIYVATDFGQGSLTTSGYPRILKQWKRGEALGAAREVYRAGEKDVWVGVATVYDPKRAYHLITRGITFYEYETFSVEGDAIVRLDLPRDVTPYVVAGQLVMHLKSEWRAGDAAYPQGALISIPYDGFLGGKRDFQVVAQPDERSSIAEIGMTRDLLLVNSLRAVKSELQRFRLRDGRWVGERVAAPPGGSITLGSASETSDDFFFTYQDFLQPTTLYLAREGVTAPAPLQRLPAFFDAAGLVVDQYEATSKDGTRVPYYLVRGSGMKADGTNPTLLYGYGGFEVPLVPSYGPALGAAWLARGGVYVLANIRGGGEFGPRWHQSALREHRQRAYDDFIAVAEDLIARRITSPRHLGISGGSNGGLLVGAVFTQRPDLFNAVLCSVPLLDMRRYHLLLAGASWMAEYGNPDVPEEWAYISKYSPYQNVVSGKRYPRVLFTTTTRDDRVHPGHARKMAARMEELGNEILFFENVEGGHGAGTTSTQRATMTAVQYTYLLAQLRGGGPSPVPE